VYILEIVLDLDFGFPINNIISLCLYVCGHERERERERDNVVYGKTNRKIINDLQWICIYVYTYMCVCICTSMRLYTCVCVCVCIFVYRLWVSVSVLQRVDSVMHAHV